VNNFIYSEHLTAKDNKIAPILLYNDLKVSFTVIYQAMHPERVNERGKISYEETVRR